MCSLFQESLGQTTRTCVFPVDLGGGWGEECGLWSSARSLRHFYCDGELFLSYNPKTHGRIVPLGSDPGCGDQEVLGHRWLSKQGLLGQGAGRAFLKELGPRTQNRLGEGLGTMRASARAGKVGRGSPVLSISLRGEHGLATSLTGSVLSSPVPPAVNVTRSQAAEGVNISLTWFQDEEPRSQDAQQSGGFPKDESRGSLVTWKTAGTTVYTLCPLGAPGGGSDPGRVRGQGEGEESRPAALGAQVIIRPVFTKGPGTTEWMANHSGGCCSY
ncbi:hypothetical protein HPG69_012673 [Diceros bicornis minor]|uniref:Uncharacterized protein n=1 Tax=Diceros bicornis minor TaxID=77932 RepID=A0A7J7EI67_DICBM|nr:hypothetical protein HPG69_012673 [Diceros bicornis minor]